MLTVLVLSMLPKLLLGAAVLYLGIRFVRAREADRVSQGELAAP